VAKFIFVFLKVSLEAPTVSLVVTIVIVRRNLKKAHRTNFLIADTVYR